MKSELSSSSEIKRSSIFCNKNYMLLFSGKLVSQFGDSLYLFSLVWFLLDNYKGATIHTGLLLMVSILPSVIIGPIFGVIVDRYDRKKIIILSDVARGCLMLLMGILIHYNALSLSYLYLGTALLGVISSLFNPACNAIIPNIVQEDLITKAVSMNSISSNASKLFGVLVGGLLYSWIGIIAIFFINASSFLLSAISEIFISIPRKNENILLIEECKYKGVNNISRLFFEIKEGYEYLKNNRGLYFIFCFLVVLNIFSFPMIQICFPYIYNNIFKTTSLEWAITEVTFVSGYIIGSIISAILPKVDKLHKRIIISYSVASIMVLLFTLPLFPVLASRLDNFEKVFLYCILAFICGSFMAMGDVSINVIYHNKVTDSVRGRVYALLNTFTNAAMPIGYVLLGSLTDKLPMYFILAIISTVLFVCSISMIRIKDIRAL